MIGVNEYFFSQITSCAERYDIITLLVILKWTTYTARVKIINSFSENYDWKKLIRYYYTAAAAIIIIIINGLILIDM